MLILFILNLIFIMILLKLNYNYFNLKMYYPFRLAELSSFFFANIFSFIFCLLFLDLFIFFIFFIVNSLIFYILYHLINMIQTSPRTRILIDLDNLLKINIEEYKKIYNEKIILDKRIKRFLTSGQIKIENDIIYYLEHKTKFLFLLHFIFKFIKKI